MNTVVQEIVAIIDRSGSMYGKEEDTIGGINTMINELKSKKYENEKIFVSIKFFDHEQKLAYNRVNIDKMNLLNSEELRPRGPTAILDALGDTLSFYIEKKIKNEDAFSSCIVYVATDGCENAIRRYDKETIKGIISNAETNYNINIMYLGANQDAILQAANIGINSNLAINYSENKDNVNSVFRSVARVASSAIRDNEQLSFTQEERNNSEIPTSFENIQPPLITRQTNLERNTSSF